MSVSPSGLLSKGPYILQCFSSAEHLTGLNMCRGFIGWKTTKALPTLWPQTTCSAAQTNSGIHLQPFLCLYFYSPFHFMHLCTFLFIALSPNSLYLNHVIILIVSNSFVKKRQMQRDKRLSASKHFWWVRDFFHSQPL